MTGRFGLDYASGTLSASEHKKVGSSFACRYLSFTPSKNLTKGEAGALRVGGIDIVSVWETTGRTPLNGFGAGVSDARAALQQAVAIGISSGRPIYFAVDFDEAPSQAPPVDAYFRGVASVLGVHRTGAYGSYWVVKRLFDAGRIAYGWQTYAWSGGNLDHRAQLYQYSNGHTVFGTGVDYNRALREDFGQWGYISHHPKPPKPPPKPPHPPTGKPHGTARAEIDINLVTGVADIHSLPADVHFQPGRKYDYLVSMNDKGHWTVSKELPDKPQPKPQPKR